MDKKILALVGVVVIVIGLFLPIISTPVASLNLLLPTGGGVGDGIFILVFALIAGGLALVGQVKHVVWPALASLCFTAYKFFDMKGQLDRMAEQLGGSEYATSFSDAFQINYLGWAVLCIGALVLLVAGIMAWTGAKPAAAPPAV